MYMKIKKINILVENLEVNIFKKKERGGEKSV